MCIYIYIHMCGACVYIYIKSTSMLRYMYICVYIYIYVILPTDAACCPDINIEDVVLLKKIGEIAENT